MGLLMLLLLGIHAYLMSPAGSAWLRRVIASQVDGAIQGSLRFEQVRYSGGRLLLRNVVLDEPDGRRVAEIAEVELRPALGGLLLRRVELSQARIADVRLHLSRGDGGELNLSRAVAPRSPPRRQEEERSAWTFAVDRLRLERGAVELVQEEASPRIIRLEGLDGEGRAGWGRERLEASLKLRGRSREPVEGPLELALEVTGRDELLRTNVSLSMAGIALETVVWGEGPDGGRAQVARLEVAPELGVALLPGYPLQVPLRLQGQARWRGDRLAGRFDVRAGSAVATAEGSVDVGEAWSEGVKVAVRHLDLAELLPGGPRSDIRADLRFRGGGWSLAELEGTLALEVHPSVVSGESIGPALMEASARGGRFLISKLSASLPGAQLSGSGHGNSQRLSAKLRLVARDLGALGRGLGAIAGREAPGLSGTGELAFSVEGPPTHPEVEVRAELPELGYREGRVSGLSLRARTADVRGLTDVRASLDARRVELGERRLERVRATLGRRGRRVTVGLEARGQERLELRLAGTLDTARKEGVLSALDFRYPRARWRLAAPARIALRERLRLTPLRLRSGQQAISLALDGGGDPRAAVIGIERLELGRLPRMLVEPGWNLAGRLDARVRVSGAAVAAKARLRGGRFRDYAGLSLDLDGVYARERARGRVRAEVAGSKLSADLDVPVEALRSRKHERIRLTALIEVPELRGMLRAFELPQSAQGAGNVRIELTGFADEPRLVLDASARRLRLREGPAMDLHLLARSGSEGRLEARLDFEALRGTGHLELKTPFTLAQLSNGSPSREQIMRVPLALEAQVGPVALAELRKAVGAGESAAGKAPKVTGVLSGRIRAGGTLADPTVEIDSRIERLGTAEAAAGELLVTGRYEDGRGEIDLSLKGAAGGTVHLAGRAEVDLSYPAILQPPSPKEVPLLATLSARDFDTSLLAELPWDVKPLGGRLQADARISGTLGLPHLAGGLEWSGGRVAIKGSGEFRDIHLVVAGTEQGIDVKKLTLSSGGGSAWLEAQVTRAEGSWVVRTRLEMDRFPIMTQEQLLATVTLRSTAEGELGGGRLRIRPLLVPEARVELPDVQRKDLQDLALPEDIELVYRGEPIGGPEGGVVRAKAPPRLREGETPLITIVADAPRNLWVRGRDVNGEVGLSQGFRLEYGRVPLRLFGSVEVMRGWLDVVGRRFELERGSRLRFSGKSSNPEVQARATYRSEREDVSVHLEVSGRMDEMELTASSEPPLSENEIYTLLATGRRTLKWGTGVTSSAGGAASLVGTLATRALEQTLARKLPLDVLTIEAGEGLVGTRLEAGRYVSDQLYIGFIGRIGADPSRGENSSAGRLEYQLSRRWSFQAEYGDAQVGGADLIWQKEY